MATEASQAAEILEQDDATVLLRGPLVITLPPGDHGLWELCYRITAAEGKWLVSFLPGTLLGVDGASDSALDSVPDTPPAPVRNVGRIRKAELQTREDGAAMVWLEVSVDRAYLDEVRGPIKWVLAHTWVLSSEKDPNAQTDAAVRVDQEIRQLSKKNVRVLVTPIHQAELSGMSPAQFSPYRLVSSLASAAVGLTAAVGSMLPSDWFTRREARYSPAHTPRMMRADVVETTEPRQALYTAFPERPFGAGGLSQASGAPCLAGSPEAEHTVGALPPLPPPRSRTASLSPAPDDDVCAEPRAAAQASAPAVETAAEALPVEPAAVDAPPEPAQQPPDSPQAAPVLAQDEDPAALRVSPGPALDRPCTPPAEFDVLPSGRSVVLCKRQKTLTGEASATPAVAQRASARARKPAPKRDV